MKTLLIAAIVGVFLFTGSAAVSWYLMNQQQMAQVDTDNTEEPDELNPANKITPVASQVKKVDQMPVALRPDAPMTVEAVMELSRSIRKTEQQLKEREQQIKRDEQGLEMLFVDLQKEQREMTAFSDQIESKIRTLRELVEKAKIENEKLDASKAELAKKEVKVEDDFSVVPEKLKKEIKEKVRVLDTMEVENIATVLKHKVKEGELDYAGLLLKGFDARKAGKILSALADPILADQILDAGNK